MADVHEARGGALAGAVGLPADRAFDLKARADGKMSRGKLAAVATSGAATPLEMQGAWTPQGGQANGRIDLTASTLTRKLSGRLGPQALFAITGTKAEPGLYDLSARVQSANLTVVAKGRGNLGERRTGPKGLALTLDTANLSKISGGPEMGPARAAGILTGTTDDARFVGTVVVDRLKLGSYGLDRISGPVQLTRKDGVLGVKGQASGSGGQGTGVLAAILGAKPSASLAPPTPPESASTRLIGTGLRPRGAPTRRRGSPPRPRQGRAAARRGGPRRPGPSPGRQRRRFRRRSR